MEFMELKALLRYFIILKKVKISLQQAVEAHRVVRRRGLHVV
jgi:hypothetical protein